MAKAKKAGLLSCDRMPRTGRASVGGMRYHVLNRGNPRETAFRTSLSIPLSSNAI
jgi:hypothetical protein